MWPLWPTLSLEALISLFGKWGKLFSWCLAQSRCCRMKAIAGLLVVGKQNPLVPFPWLWEGSPCWLTLHVAGTVPLLEASASLAGRSSGLERRLFQISHKSMNIRTEGNLKIKYPWPPDQECGRFPEQEPQTQTAQATCSAPPRCRTECHQRVPCGPIRSAESSPPPPCWGGWWRLGLGARPQDWQWGCLIITSFQKRAKPELSY